MTYWIFIPTHARIPMDFCADKYQNLIYGWASVWHKLPQMITIIVYSSEMLYCWRASAWQWGKISTKVVLAQVLMGLYFLQRYTRVNKLVHCSLSISLDIPFFKTNKQTMTDAFVVRVPKWYKIVNVSENKDMVLIMICCFFVNSLSLLLQFR